MTDHDYTNQGILEAASKHAPHVDLPAYFEARDNKGAIAPYVAQDEQMQDTGQLKPAQIRSLKIFTISGSVVCAWVGFLGVCATGAMNAVFQWGAGALFLVACLSGMRGGSSSESPTYSTRRSGGGSHGASCGCAGTTIIQNNNFGGGNANQTNG
jgi:hypothetical protein